MKQFLLYILMIFPLMATAQDVSFRAEASAEEVEVGEQFSISYTIEGADFTGFRPPEFEGLQFLGRGNSESRSISGTGEIQVKKIFTFYLAALSNGTYTIKPATLTVRNKTFNSKAVTIKVVDNASRGSSVTPNTNNQNLPSDDVFIRAYLDKKEAYVGEQVLLTFKLYTRYNIRNYTPPTTNYDGFWKKDVTINRPQLQREVVNNKVYNTAILHQVILFPQLAGNQSLNPAEMSASVEVDFFRVRSINLKSNKLNIKIKPLPQQGKPEYFTGAVGSFNISANTSATNTTTDNPVTIAVKISGTGNLSLIEAPALDFAESWDIYEPEVSENITIQSGKLTGSKTFEFLAIPGEAGKLEQKEIKFAYFDPNTQRYVTRTAGLPSIQVTQGVGKPTAQGGTENMPDLMTEEVNFKNSSENILSSPFFYTLMALPFLIFLPLFYYKKNKDAKESDEVFKRHSAARKLFNLNIKKAEEALATNEQKFFYNYLLKAINDYLVNKYGLPVSELSKSRIEQELISKKAGENEVKELISIINKSEAAVYAPPSPLSDLQNDLNKTVLIIENLERK